jgi:hypothetical protein
MQESGREDEEKKSEPALPPAQGEAPKENEVKEVRKREDEAKEDEIKVDGVKRHNITKITPSSPTWADLLRKLFNYCIHSWRNLQN